MKTRTPGALWDPLAHPALFVYPRDTGPTGALRNTLGYLRILVRFLLRFLGLTWLTLVILRNLASLGTYLSKYLFFTLSYSSNSSYPRNLARFLRVFLGVLRVFLGRFLGVLRVFLETFGYFFIVLFLFLGDLLRNFSGTFPRGLRV